MNNFLDLPAGGGGARPGTLPANRPGGAGGPLAGGAASDFLHNRPSTLPATGGPRPGGDQIAGLPGRGGGDGDRGFRPGAGGDGIRGGGEGRGVRPGGGGDGIRGGGDGRGVRPGQRGEGQFRPGDGNWANNRPDRITDRNQWNQWRNNNITQINNDWRNFSGNNRGWYDNNWWNNHPHGHYHFGAGFNCWGWAAWPAVRTWFPWNWAQPVYYNYGYPDSVYYVDNSVYYGNQQVATAEEYAQQAEQIATSIPQDVTPAESDWMSLGVFALTNDGQPSGADPTLFLQLTVSKQGIIAGTLQNTATDTVKSVEGMVDKDSQRAAWTVVGETRPLMETGISNLTQDSAPALVHFADGTTQQWLLVRLEQPAAN